MLSFPVLSTRLSVCFLSPFLASLPQLFHECLPCAFAFGLFPFHPVSFVPFCSGSDYSAFLFFRSVLPGSALQLPSRCCPLRFRFAGFPLPFRPVSRASLPIIVLGFSAGFLSSFPVPLPQPLSWCLPSSGSLRPLLFGLFPSDSLPFVCSSSVLTTQLLPFLFPSSRSPLAVVPSVFSVPFLLPGFSLPVTPVSMRFVSALVLSFLFFFSPASVLPRRWLPRSRPLAFRFSGFPLAFALGSGYSAFGSHPLADVSRAFSVFRSAFDYSSTGVFICQLLFSKSSNFFQNVFEKVFFDKSAL